MKAEILCIGSELVLGDTVNTNAAFISRKLAELGINCYFHSAVGDNPERIKIALDVAVDRADLIVVTGGLGPTDDDITMQVIAEFINKKLVLNKKALTKIKNFFEDKNLIPIEKSYKQALLPESCKVIENQIGTAPGALVEYEKGSKNVKIMIFPGVPKELYSMWENFAEDYLKKSSDSFIVKRFLNFMDLPEATIAESINDLMQQSNPTVAPLVAPGMTKVRVAAKAETIDSAKCLINETENIIKSRLGQYLCGFDDVGTETLVGEILLNKNLTISLAESCTGGLISSRLTDVSGSSGYIMLNLVTYSNEAKINMLNVPSDVVDQYGAVSEQTAIAMSKGIMQLSKTDIGLGITGIAGPTGGTKEKPVGLVYISISNKNVTEVYEVKINSKFSREDIKYNASQYALNYLRKFLIKHYN